MYLFDTPPNNQNYLKNIRCRLAVLTRFRRPTSRKNSTSEL